MSNVGFYASRARAIGLLCKSVHIHYWCPMSCDHVLHVSNIISDEKQNPVLMHDQILSELNFGDCMNEYIM